MSHGASSLYGDIADISTSSNCSRYPQSAWIHDSTARGQLHPGSPVSYHDLRVDSPSYPATHPHSGIQLLHTHTIGPSIAPSVADEDHVPNLGNGSNRTSGPPPVLPKEHLSSRNMKPKASKPGLNQLSSKPQKRATRRMKAEQARMRRLLKKQENKPTLNGEQKVEESTAPHTSSSPLQNTQVHYEDPTGFVEPTGSEHIHCSALELRDRLSSQEPSRQKQLYMHPDRAKMLTRAGACPASKDSEMRLTHESESRSTQRNPSSPAIRWGRSQASAPRHSGHSPSPTTTSGRQSQRPPSQPGTNSYPPFLSSRSYQHTGSPGLPVQPRAFGPSVSNHDKISSMSNGPQYTSQSGFQPPKAPTVYSRTTAQNGPRQNDPINGLAARPLISGLPSSPSNGAPNPSMNSTPNKTRATPTRPRAMSITSTPRPSDPQKNPSSSTVKQEPSPPRPPSPMNVDAHSLSLYEQLGLPQRKSGSHRVPRPNIPRSERDVWSSQWIEHIRWVRGKDVAPLVVGKVFWRSDGVCFDWEVPKEELDKPLMTAPPESTSESTNDLPPASSVADSVMTLLSDVAHSIQQEQSSATDQASSRAPSSQHSAPLNLSLLQRLEDIHTVVPIGEISTSISVKQEKVDAEMPNDCGPIVASPRQEMDVVTTTSTLGENDSANLGNQTQGQPLGLTLRLTPVLMTMNTAPLIGDSHPLNIVAHCFLDRYTRCFDDFNNREKLVDAYAQDAMMSLQFNDLPTEGQCTRVGMPKKQSHYIVDFAEREEGRNLLLESDKMHGTTRPYKGLFTGPQDIAAELMRLEAFAHFPGSTTLRGYQFTVAPFDDRCILIDYSGNLYTQRPDMDPQIALQFHRSFILVPNMGDISSRLDWPWVIINDQNTLFHRPGVVCQCPP